MILTLEELECTRPSKRQLAVKVLRKPQDEVSSENFLLPF